MFDFSQEAAYPEDAETDSLLSMNGDLFGAQPHWPLTEDLDVALLSVPAAYQAHVDRQQQLGSI